MPRTPRRPRSVRSLMGAVVVTATLVGTALTVPAAQAATPQLTVDLGQTTGAVTFATAGAYTPNIDRITVAPVTG
ncbi:hypothetical protein ACFVW1_15475 [Streptomyces olivochromogenes]|uniref:hypothetical protein n=1 Tax=Streptomyces olivochromogenes TaxID=1963 RepID=UPI0036DE8509